MYKDGQALSETQSTGSKMLCCDARPGVSLDFALTICTCTWIQEVMDTFFGLFNHYCIQTFCKWNCVPTGS